MSFDFFPSEQYAAELKATRNPSVLGDPGVWDNFASGAGRYAMRTLAETGRAIDLLGAVGPIAIDAVTGGTERQDAYFREHEEVFQGAVDYWTPAPGEVGAAGQIAGQLAGGLLQAVVSPALLVGTAQLSTAEELTRQGVDPGAALVAGDIAGIGTAVGVRLPFLGNTLTSRMASGSIGNVVQGGVMAGATHAVLDAADSPVQAAQYDAFDLKARALDAMLGVAFGGLAHLDARLTATDQAALLVANQARHLEDTTAPALPISDADLTMHTTAVRQAVDQLLRGEPVTIDGAVRDMRTIADPARIQEHAEVRAEVQRLAGELAPVEAPIVKVPPPVSPETFTTLDAIAHDAPDAALTAAQRNIAEYPDMHIPSGRMDDAGNPVLVRAADAMAEADANVAHAQRHAGSLYATAANCLLGAF